MSNQLKLACILRMKLSNLLEKNINGENNLYSQPMELQLILKKRETSRSKMFWQPKELFLLQASKLLRSLLLT
jgi:hypothetical protein